MTEPAPQHESRVDRLRRGPSFSVRVVALIVLVAYAVAFVLENSKHVHLHFVFLTASVSLIWLILLSLALGALGGILAVQLERRRRRR